MQLRHSHRARSGLVLGLVAFLFAAFVGVGSPASAVEGSLDPTWDDDGVVITSFGDEDAANGVAVQEDGKVVVAGIADGDMYVARYTTSGDLDTTFSGDGFILIDFGGSDSAEDVVVTEDGSIAVVGSTTDDADPAVSLAALAMVTPAGALDTTFSTDGKETTDLPGGTGDVWNAVANGPGGTLVTAGTNNSTGTGAGQALVGRYTEAGALDPTFDGDGLAVVDIGDRDVAHGVATSDGTVVIAGSTVTGDDSDAFVARLTATGALDPTFSTDGIATLDTGADDEFFDVALAGSEPVAAGTTAGNFLLARFTSTGGLDATLDDDGVVITDLGGDDAATGIVLFGGLITLAGVGGPDGPHFALARYTDGGDLDTSFAGGGIVLTNIGVPSGALDAALTSDGKIVTAGFVVGADGPDTGVVRYADVETGASVAGQGYWLVAADGGIFSFEAEFHGSMGATPLNSPVVGMAADLDGEGYWFVAGDGGIFSFDATFHGSMGATPLNSPVVGMAADPDGEGYWFVAADGGVFAFDAEFHGSMGGIPLNSPVVGMAADPDGEGYYLVAADGGIFTFEAEFHGSMGATALNSPVVGMAADPDGIGYWFVAADGGIFSFDAQFHGSMGATPLNSPVVGMAADPDGLGYWFAASDGGVFAFDADFQGSMGATPLNSPVVGMAAEPTNL